ncbi:hypothetical protein BGZ65_001964 [Modicella reniformis]|uniref:C2 domain-containing protein n=1 Tax=Modicella reniformis TaxID=1440133 RepID=A0A9P6MJ24_9FUNG|nr:hypothetical protein BGZ65_001964 [Modicella reniformis]
MSFTNNMMTSQQPQGATLTITAHSANLLKDVETFGKQDPYFRFTLDISDPKSFQKTFVHKNAGKTPVWNQTFTVPLNGEPELYIEIMDDETTADAVIAFAAIPIHQVTQQPGSTMNGVFDVYTAEGKPNGDINLTLQVLNMSGMNYSMAQPSSHRLKGQSHITVAHQKRIKSIKNKETISDAGMAVAGGLLALGAGLLTNKFVNDEKKKEEARQEAERQQHVEHERFEKERKRLEEERAAFERQQQEAEEEEERRRRQQQQESQSHHHHHHQHQEHDDHSHGGHVREWDPVGNHAAGGKVMYHGRLYICLQGHQSNPTWTPTDAHSLWRAD